MHLIYQGTMQMHLPVCTADVPSAAPTFQVSAHSDVSGRAASTRLWITLR